MQNVDSLVPDPKVAEEFHTTLMTLWRWDHDPTKVALGWPPKVKIGDRNYRSRNLIEAFKRNLITAALDARQSPAPKSLRGAHASKVVA
jgi:hypothetical protein